MFGRDIRKGTLIGNRKVASASDGFRGLFYKGRPAGVEPVRRVIFEGGGKAEFPADKPVPGASGYVERLPAGNAASKLAQKAERIRAHDGHWRGEGATRHTKLVAKTNMYDYGRVNGSVGAAFGGVGSVAQTGPSF